ncbi:MAG: helix-turn-helix transcriptional regulator [Zoogloeaceae bacterium]|nr:helix-turn-helix transcriptional regulator [Zoogloeaceae bacterium]
MLKFKLKQLLAEKEFAERKQITLKSIAEEMGINRMTLSKMSNRVGANVTTDNLDKLCAYFGCRIEDLVEYIPDQPATKSEAKTETKGQPRKGLLRR